MNTIGRLIENRAVMFAITCVNSIQDFTAVQSAVVGTRISIRNYNSVSLLNTMRPTYESYTNPFSLVFIATRLLAKSIQSGELR